MRQLLDHAAENNYGIPAFNINNLEQIQAVMSAAYEINSPVIMQASSGAFKYAGREFLKYLFKASIKEYPNIPIAIHQDHGKSVSACIMAIQNGFTSVMIDGSLQEDGKTVASYLYNIAISKKVTEIAHSVGVTVEAELGVLGSLETMRSSKEDGHGTNEVLSYDQLLTNPDEAVDFVNKTKCDALAIAIGTSHGAYKFSKIPTNDVLSIQRIKEIHSLLPNTHLVLHGSSSIPQNLLEDIRKFGGNIKETYGVPVQEIKKSIKYGVRKINIDTDLRLSATAAIRRFFIEHPSKFDLRDYLKLAREAMKKICISRYKDFGCEGMADKIKPISLDNMSKKYENKNFL